MSKLGPDRSLPNSISFVNDAVLVTSSYTGSTLFYAALSFLESLPNANEGTVIIYTPLEALYPKSSQDPIDIEDGLDWRVEVEVEDDKKVQERRETKLQADEWLLQNGMRGSTAALLSRIQIIRVDSLAQLAICLATYPSSQLDQDAGGNVMIILHDISLLPNHPVNDEIDPPQLPSRFSSRGYSEAPSYAPSYEITGTDKGDGKRLEAYLMIVAHALDARLMAGQESKLVLFEYRLEDAVKSVLGRYLVEESIPQLDT